MAVKVDTAKCTKEAECPAAADCPFGALAQSAPSTCPEVDADACTECGICCDSCPSGALSVD